MGTRTLLAIRRTQWSLGEIHGYPLNFLTISPWAYKLYWSDLEFLPQDSVELLESSVVYVVPVYIPVFTIIPALRDLRCVGVNFVKFYES